MLQRSEKERARKEAEERRAAESKEKEKEKENTDLKEQSPQKETAKSEKVSGDAIGDEKKLVFEDVESNGDVNTDDKKDSARSSDSSKSTTSRSTRLKVDLLFFFASYRSRF